MVVDEPPPLALVIVLGLVVLPLLGVAMIKVLDRRWSHTAVVRGTWASHGKQNVVCMLAFFGGPILAEVVMVASLFEGSLGWVGRLIRWGALVGCFLAVFV